MAKAPKSTPDTNAERRIARTAAEKATETLRDRIVVALVGFVMTGIVGTALTTWIQQRGWAWQNRVAKIDKDTENAMAAYRSASELVNARWYATYRVARALERGASGDDMKALRDTFETADRDWSLRYTNVAREVDFYIDTPFNIDIGDNLTRVWGLSCSDFALSRRDSEAIDARSARAVLEIINHCHGRTKDELEPLVYNNEAAVDKPALIATAYRRLDHLYRTNEVLRCVI
ncbi:MAG: hypothetical protein LCH61_12325, partial [Proteobacteria bacterium]|nr:hypothetical protein [Pseudomonadota bacterium]